MRLNAKKNGRSKGSGPKRTQTGKRSLIAAGIPLAHHFSDKPPAVRRIFQTLRKRVAGLGRVRVGSVASEITFQNRHPFAACQVRPRHIVLYLPAAGGLDSRRYGKPVQVGRNKFLYAIRLSAPGDIDAELVGLLRQAYQNAS